MRIKDFSDIVFAKILVEKTQVNATIAMVTITMICSSLATLFNFFFATRLPLDFRNSR